MWLLFNSPGPYTLAMNQKWRRNKDSSPVSRYCIRLEDSSYPVQDLKPGLSGHKVGALSLRRCVGCSVFKPGLCCISAELRADVFVCDVLRATPAVPRGWHRHSSQSSIVPGDFGDSSHDGDERQRHGGLHWAWRHLPLGGPGGCRLEPPHDIICEFLCFLECLLRPTVMHALFSCNGVWQYKIFCLPGNGNIYLRLCRNASV